MEAPVNGTMASKINNLSVRLRWSFAKPVICFEDSVQWSCLELLACAIELDINAASAARLLPGNELVDKDGQDENGAHSGVHLKKSLVDCCNCSLDR